MQPDANALAVSLDQLRAHGVATGFDFGLVNNGVGHLQGSDVVLIAPVGNQVAQRIFADRGERQVVIRIIFEELLIGPAGGEDVVFAADQQQPTRQTKRRTRRDRLAITVNGEKAQQAIRFGVAVGAATIKGDDILGLFGIEIDGLGEILHVLGNRHGAIHGFAQTRIIGDEQPQARELVVDLVDAAVDGGAFHAHTQRVASQTGIGVIVEGVFGPPAGTDFVAGGQQLTGPIKFALGFDVVEFNRLRTGTIHLVFSGFLLQIRPRFGFAFTLVADLIELRRRISPRQRRGKERCRQQDHAKRPSSEQPRRPGTKHEAQIVRPT